MFRVRTTILISLAAVATVGASPASSVEVPARDVHAELLWTVGGRDLLLGEVSEIVVDDAGRIYVLDRQVGVINVLDADGTWLRTMGRAGEGPGEFRDPSDMFFTPEGQVAVVQQMPPKIALLSADGEALDDIRLAHSTDGMRVLLRGGGHPNGMVLTTAVLAETEDGGLSTRTELSTYERDGSPITAMFATFGGIDFRNLTVEERHLDIVALHWTVTREGHIAAVTDYDAYRIEVRTLDGTVLHVLERDVAPRERTEAELRAVHQRYEFIIDERKVEVVPLKTARVVDEVYARPAGGVWAMMREDAATERAAGRLFRLDAFDGEGTYLEQLVVRGDIDPEIRDVFVRGDLVFAVTTVGEGLDEEVVLHALRLDASATGR